jgi:ribose transport system permease protein
MTDIVKTADMTTTPTNYARQFERVALLLVWALTIALFTFLIPNNFLNWGNFSIMFASYAPAALLALAIIIPLTAGDYDLSVGATLTLSASTIGVLNVWQQMPIGWVLVIVLLMGLGIGLFHSLFIIYFRVPSLVVTLGSTSLMSGIVQLITNSSTIGGIDNSLIMAAVGYRLFGIPYAFYYALAAALVMWYIFDFMPLGRKLLFVGRGREVARLNGISVNKVRVGALCMSAVLASAAAFSMQACWGRQIPIRVSIISCRPLRRHFSVRPRSSQDVSIRGEPSLRSISLQPASPGFPCSEFRFG